MKPSNNKKKRRLEKRIYNYRLYVCANLFDVLMGELYNEEDLSENTRNLFYQLSLSLHKDVGHLKCDELDDCYIVEEGYDYYND